MTESAVTPAAFFITDGTIGVDEQGSGDAGMLGSRRAGKHGGLEAWPNPGSEIVNCQFSIVDFRCVVLVTIYDLFGREVHESMHTLQQDVGFSMDVSRLTPGLYMIVAKDENTLLGSGKLVISR
jgi:hypothetical protein